MNIYDSVADNPTINLRPHDSLDRLNMNQI